MPENSRRLFLKNSLMSLVAVPVLNHITWAATESVTVTLEGRADNLGDEIVSFGLPLSFGFLHESQKVRIADERGAEVPAAVRSLEPWRTGGRDGSIRSLLIQFRTDFSKQKTRRVVISFNTRRTHSSPAFVPVSQTLIEASGLKGPRVAAVLPADWLCRSGIVGPQVPATQSGEYSSYDRFVEKNFPGSLAYLDSKVYHEWLFDRTTCYYKMYVRTGDSKYLDAAYHAANFVRDSSASPSCASVAWRIVV